jgi:hypothetical protein
MTHFSFANNNLGLLLSPPPLPCFIFFSHWLTKQHSKKVNPVAAIVHMGQEEAASWESPRKVKAPARRLSVPPPPGRPGTRSFSRGPPEDDPFFAAYLACTTCAASRPEPKKGRRRFTWAGLGLGLGLSCKGSGAAVEQSMVKLAKRPDLDPRDA